MKRLLVAFAFCLSVSVAQAQAPLPQYTLTLTNDQLNVVGKALGKLTGEESFEAMTVILGQVRQQQIAAAEAKAAADKAALAKAVEDEIKKREEQPK